MNHSFTTTEVKEMVKKAVIDTLDKADRIWTGKLNNMPVPNVAFDIKAFGFSGMCCYRKWTLRFHPLVMMVDPETYCKQTVVHEVAHLVTYKLYGSKAKAHGPEWKTVMRLLGADPVRCSSYNLTGIKRPGYHEYRCNCHTHYVATRTHNKIQRGATYHCEKCKGKLVLAERKAA